ncbi:MAG: Dyp-type peroxidase [Actinomycetota bacterium]|nr:Dyp-type peroxidase [Actinomycetota bacterium]MDQ6946487.1 Dyp-type peroxidase [Actinomycetota bacterium]
MATAQPSIFATMGKNQWYVHLSRVEGADLEKIKSVLRDTRAHCEAEGINLVLGFGPSLLADLGAETPEDFQPFVTIEAGDGSGRQAKGTQEELLLWLNNDDKGKVWLAQFQARNGLEGHMKVARETPTFIFGASLDMTGFIDGTGNPPTEEAERAAAIVPEGQAGAGGSFINAQRWVHDLAAWNQMPVEEQEKVFGRTKPASNRLDPQPEFSHLSHVELHEGAAPGSDPNIPKRGELVRRSTPYAFHDGTVGLYFMAFCKTQAPIRERLRLMYAVDGGVRDRLVDFSNPASGSFYFAPAVETLDSTLGAPAADASLRHAPTDVTYDEAALEEAAKKFAAE